MDFERRAVHDGDEASGVVRDVALHDDGGPAVFAAGGFGIQYIALCGGEEVDAAVQTDDRQVQMAAQCRDGKVTEREDGAAHDVVHGVAVARGQFHFRDGVFLGQFDELDAVLRGETVIFEILCGFLYIFECSHRGPSCGAAAGNVCGYYSTVSHIAMIIIL